MSLVSTLRAAGTLGDQNHATYQTANYSNGGASLQIDVMVELQAALSDFTDQAVEFLRFGTARSYVVTGGATFDSAFLYWKVGASEASQAIALALGAPTPEYVTNDVLLQPNGAAWNDAAIDALVIGIRAFFEVPSGGTVEVRVSEFWAEVYGPVAGVARSGVVGHTGSGRVLRGVGAGVVGHTGVGRCGARTGSGQIGRRGSGLVVAEG